MVLPFEKILRRLKQISPQPTEDGWRVATQSYFRTEHSKFVLAVFRLDLWSDRPSSKDPSLAGAKRHVIERLAVFLKNHPILHKQLRWRMFSTQRTRKDLLDIVDADFHENGTLERVQLWLDTGHDRLELLHTDARNQLNATVIQAYNRLKDTRDEHRPRHLKKYLSQEADDSKENRQYLERTLNSPWIHFEILPPADAGRFQPPDFMKRKHPGLGGINLCCRLTADFTEADLWFQMSHILIDGVPTQKILSALKEQWGICGGLVLPSTSASKNEIPPLLCSTRSGKRARYSADQLIDFRPLLKVREELNQRYAGQLSESITVISMLGWGLAHEPLFAKHKFLFPIDLPSVHSEERTLGFVSIRPGLYIHNSILKDRFLAYQQAFNRKLSRARARTNGIYKLFELFAFLPPPAYWFMQKFMKWLFAEVLGSVVITMIKDADFFMAPFSDVISEGFIAIGNYSLATEDKQKVGIVSVKSTQGNVRQYLSAVRAVVSDFNQFNPKRS